MRLIAAIFQRKAVIPADILQKKPVSFWYWCRTRRTRTETPVQLTDGHGISRGPSMAIEIPWNPSLASDGSTMVFRSDGNISEKILSTWELTCSCGECLKQDGRLAPAYFSQEYKYFDQHICPQLKTKLLFKIWFAKVFYKHQFHHWFLYSMQNRGVSRLFVQTFLSHSTEKFRWGTLRWIRKFRVAKNFMQKKEISLNSVEKSSSHSADKIRRRTLLCFERILVSKIFKQRSGEASRFCRKFFYLRGPKKLRQGTILCFRKFLVGKNILWIRGKVSRFSVEVFVSLYRNISFENTLVFQKTSFIENFHA